MDYKSRFLGFAFGFAPPSPGFGLGPGAPATGLGGAGFYGGGSTNL
jgi:hypothetical protein